MDTHINTAYYTIRKVGFLKAFDGEARSWKSVMTLQYGEDVAKILVKDAREEFVALLPCIPYIGGDDNHLTGTFVESVRSLAFYKAMQKHGRTAEEAGKVLYDAIVARLNEAPTAIPPSDKLSIEQLMQRRKRRAEESQERRYPEDYVYEFLAGDGETFDYGYDFLECATQKFYHAQNADEFTPFYCFLDYPKSRTLGLSRTMTLSEGSWRCNPRFKEGKKTAFEWPPPFLRRI